MCDWLCPCQAELVQRTGNIGNPEERLVGLLDQMFPDDDTEIASPG